MEKPTRIKVICKNCGDAWEMPNIGVIPVMEECPNCRGKAKFKEQRFRGGQLLKRKTFDDRYEQEVQCSFSGKLVTIVISKKGLVVCRNWKKCEHHGKRVDKGGIVVNCPEKDIRESIRGYLSERTHGSQTVRNTSSNI
uniref:Uncharacterized protein n=1 Tax=viral metagenome TaxID=1070528 RepID=A0A6M3M1K6_9ZZZZ